MRRRTGVAGALTLLSVVLAGPAAAQQGAAGEPTAFESDLLRQRSFFDYGGFEPSLDSLLPEGSVSRWRLSAGATAEYSDNGNQDASDRYGFRTDGNLGVGWLRRSPRFSGAADYSLGFPLHEEGAYEDEGSARHALAGTVDWQASPRFRLGGGGHVTQNLEQGLSSSLSGVRSNYQNRSDEYGARASYEWRMARDVSNDSYYRFSYRNYASGDAEGGDTLSHQAGTNLGWQVAPRDGIRFGYGYAFEDDKETDEERQNHTGTVGWDHAFLSFPGNRRSDLRVTYSADRGLYGGGARDQGGSDYWSHGASAEYAWAPTPRTEASVNGGYQWVVPDEGSDGGGWTYGGRLSHRLTERTTGEVSYNESWEYRATSSQSDATDLTNVRRGDLSLENRLGAKTRARVAGFYEQGDVERDISSVGSEDYKDAGGSASLSGDVGRDGFWGLGYVFLRRDSDGEEDDYRLHRGDAFYRHAILAWLDGALSYRYERRDYDPGSDSEDYDENRVTATLRAHY